MSLTLAVIDPAVKIAETDCFNRLSLSSPFPLTYHLPKLGGMDSLNALSRDPDGIIILGSASSVNDSEPWQVAMNAWLLPRMRKGIPTLGLCYGHQLIAHLFGGRVDFLTPEKKKLVGFRSLTLPANRLWGEPRTGALAVTHREAVVDYPKDFELIGTTPEVKCDAIAHRHLPIWSFQAHPEATESFLRAYSIAYTGKPPLEFGHSLLRNFLDFVAKRH